MIWTKNGANSVKSGDYFIHRRPAHLSGTGAVQFALYHGPRFLRSYLDPDLAKRGAEDHSKGVKL